MTVKNTAGASRRLWIASALALACGSAWPQNAPRVFLINLKNI